MTYRSIILACLVSACGPLPFHQSHSDGPDGYSAPSKPPLPASPPPPNVTRVVLPDGTISITIREPRCTTCLPWTF